ncbi:MAG TPA: condensation domain-containing protein, partial [Pyrinomonadaceae bacterium]
IRGMRVECGEVEQAIREECGVSEAVVVAQERGGERRLVAYVVRGSGKGAGEVKSALGGRLPEYMIPVMVKEVEEIPLTRNGKVDRVRLAKEVEEEEGGRVELGEEAKTPVEEVLAGVWSEVLGISRVSIHDNFFELGGHSLLATQIVSRIQELFEIEVPVRSLFEAPTVAGLAEIVETHIRTGHGMNVPPVEAGLRDDNELMLSFAQQRMWLAHQMAPESTAYHISSAVRLTGPLNVPVLEQTLTEIVRRHESLRTTFVMRNGKPVQVISPAATVALPQIDLGEWAEGERESEALRLASEEAHMPFDLARGPLLRALLLRLGPDEHIVQFTLHHIIADAWSLGVLSKEVAALYDAFAAGKASPLPELAIQYADYSYWQRQWLQGEVFEAQLDYWRNQLSGAPPMLELPTDRPRPPAQTFNGARSSFQLSTELSRTLKDLSRREGATLFMTLLAVFQTLLSRYTGQNDIVVGTNIANRNLKSIEGLIGFFVNNLALRTDLSGNLSFRDLLGRVREVCLGAYVHQDMPFEKLLEALQPERGHSSIPAFLQVMFALQNAPMSSVQLSGVTLSPVEISNVTARADLVMIMWETEDELSGVLEYNTDLFNESTITLMLSRFQALLEAAAEHPDQDLKSIVLVDEEESQQLIYAFNDALE